MAKRSIVITGGAGFIGSHVVRLFVNKYPEYNIINLDKLTYAGNLANLKDIEDKPNYKFVKMDICDFEAFYQLMQDEKVDGIIFRIFVYEKTYHMISNETSASSYNNITFHRYIFIRLLI